MPPDQEPAQIMLGVTRPPYAAELLQTLVGMISTCASFNTAEILPLMEDSIQKGKIFMLLCVAILPVLFFSCLASLSVFLYVFGHVHKAEIVPAANGFTMMWAKGLQTWT